MPCLNIRSWEKEDNKFKNIPDILELHRIRKYWKTKKKSKRKKFGGFE